MTPKISVILPVYNGDVYLKQSIDSILNQTYQDFELIIVDDCSTDNTPFMAKEYAKIYPQVTYIKNDTNLKLPETLNKGFAQATGDYWSWTSCDNLYLSDAFEQLMAEITRHDDLGLVYATMEIINQNGHGIESIEAGPPQDLILRNVVGACFLYKAAVAKQIGLYNKDMFLCEDYDYWLRLASVSSIKPINKTLYQYRRHSESLSHRYEREIIAKGIKLQKKYYPVFVKNRKQAAHFYAFLRGRDIYNPFRQLYLLMVLFFSPKDFFKEIIGLIKRRF